MYSEDYEEILEAAGRIDEDSIAQLVGYDVDGNEVYEGDTIEFNGGTYTARLEEYWDGDIPAGEDSPSLPVHRKKLAEAYPPFKTACKRFIAAYQELMKESEVAE